MRVCGPTAKARYKPSSHDPDMEVGLERYFEFKRLGTNWRTELLAGLTTFMTMA
jgi:hypothetical protein